MITVFLLKWPYIFNISDNALGMLIKIFNKTIFIIIKITKTSNFKEKSLLRLLSTGRLGHCVSLMNRLGMCTMVKFGRIWEKWIF